MSNKGMRILVIDDEPQMRRLLKVALDAHGFDIGETASGREGLETAAIFKPDLILLDMGLPDMDGLEVVKRIREWSPVPIIILSVRDQEAEKVAALDNGADDYVTKPFGMGELLARIRTALRHATSIENEPVLDFGSMVIDLAYRRVSVDGEEIKLTPTEYEILKTLALHRGKVLTQRQMLRTVWGPIYEQEVHYLRVFVGQLRHKIEKDPSRPKTYNYRAGCRIPVGLDI